MPIERVTQRRATLLRRFLDLEASGGLALIGAAALALIVANSPAAGLYEQLLSVPFGVRLGALQLDKPLLLWINDGLMAVFFLLVSLELKREVLNGQLASASQTILPGACALGGMLLPALVFLSLNPAGSAGSSGWPIPMATDIAFALGILLLLGDRVPMGLRLLLTTIAVVDDLIAIMLIAVLYSGDLQWSAFAIAGAVLAVSLALNRLGVTRLAPYLLLGTVMWVAVLKSGVHATVAGVLVGLTIPIADPKDPDHSPLEELESALHPWVAYLILPVFAFANAGVPLAGFTPATLLEPLPLGIAAALFLGKTTGVFGFGAALVRTGRIKLPEGVTLLSLLGIAVLCGIGFTMSLFISSLAFEHSGDHQIVQSRIGILAGSTISALVGYGILRRSLRQTD